MDRNGWTTHERLIRVDNLMRKWRRNLQYIRDMILDGTLTPLTLERKTPEGFLCGHDVDMGGFEPRPWKQFGAELDVYFDRDEIERIENEHPEVIAPPPPPSPSWLAPPLIAPKVTGPLSPPPARPAPSLDLATPRDSPVGPSSPRIGGKTPEELLQLHERASKRWTLKALADEFGGEPTEPFLTRKSRIVRALSKAKKERGTPDADA